MTSSTETPRPSARPDFDNSGGKVQQQEPTRVILVPLDGSTEAKEALAAARLVSEIFHAPIHVVHAVKYHVPASELLRKIGLSRDDTAGFIFDQIIGPAARAIVRAAREKHAMLIVMTTRGKTAYLGRVVRPVVEEVIETSSSPVLLVRPELGQKVAAMTGLRRILLPLDGAPSSAAVIGPALDLASRSGADVDLLYVATRAPRPCEPGTLTAPLYVDQLQHEWPAWAHEFATRFGTDLGNRSPLTPLHLFLRIGDPATEIVRLAGERDCDVIVLEWRGSLDPPHANVVRGVLVNTPCLVLLVHTRWVPPAETTDQPLR